MNDLDSAIAYVKSIKPRTMREKRSKEATLELLYSFGPGGGLVDDPEGQAEAYAKFKNLEEVLEAIGAGVLPVEDALKLEREGKGRVTYIEAFEAMMADKEEGEDDGQG